MLQEDFPIYEAVPLGSPESMAAFAERRSAAGINRFQLKVGDDPRDDAVRTRAVVETAGDDTIVVADANLITAAVSHLAASTRPESLLMTSFMNDWTDGHIAGYQPRSVNGRGSAPTAPGLGIEVDTSLLGQPLFSVEAGQRRSQQAASGPAYTAEPHRRQNAWP